ncbi:hypothetical protein ACRAWF_25075 [Streptomyces sp. L7]
MLGLAERIVRVAHESKLPPSRPRDYEATPAPSNRPAPAPATSA